MSGMIDESITHSMHCEESQESSPGSDPAVSRFLVICQPDDDGAEGEVAFVCGFGTAGENLGT